MSNYAGFIVSLFIAVAITIDNAELDVNYGVFILALSAAIFCAFKIIEQLYSLYTKGSL